jgi:CBS domain-containing protein
VKLRDFLSADRVVTPLAETSLVGAAQSLLARLAESGAVVDVDRLRERVSEVRSEDLVVLNGRAFVLHYRTDAVSALHVALGTARTDVRRMPGGDDVHTARIVLLAVAPPRQAARLLQVVRGFARLLSADASVDEILAQDDAAHIVGLRIFEEYRLPEQLTVRDVMTEGPRTTHPDLPLRDAAREMIDTGLGALPVVDDEGHLLGMLSERELVRHLLTTQVLSDPRQVTQPRAQRKTVREVMTRQVLCVSPEQPIAEVASLMSNKDVDRVPVVREGRLVGFLTRGDIVRKLIGS